MTTRRKRRMSRKERIFAKEFARTGNASASARTAGYKWPASVASKVKEQPNVKAELSEWSAMLDAAGADDATVAAVFAKGLRANKLVGPDLVKTEDHPTRLAAARSIAEMRGRFKNDADMGLVVAEIVSVMAPAILEFVPEDKRALCASKLREAVEGMK